MFPDLSRFRVRCSRLRPAALPAAVACLVLAVTAGAAPAPADSTPVYDLARCVDEALRSSPSLGIAAENAAIAGQSVRRAWGGFLPSITLSRQYSHSDRTDFDLETYTIAADTIWTHGGDYITLPRQVPTGILEDVETKSSYRDWRVSANLNLFDGLGKFGELKAAREDLAAARLDRRYARDLVVQNVATAYIDLLRYERLAEVAAEARDLAARELERTETYFRIGSAARSDVLQAKVRLKQTELDLVRARNSVAQAFAQLAHAMNRPLHQRFAVDRSLLQSEFRVGDLDSLYRDALALRPDLASRRHQVRARAGDVRSAGAGLWPRLDVFANYTRYRNESPYRFGSQKSENFSYGYQLNWNVFDRFQTLTARSQAKARARIAEYNLDQARLDAQLEIRQLYNQLLEARERIDLSRETIASSEEELRQAEQRFRVGSGTMLDKITAQVNLAQARADEVQAICDFLIASFKMNRATGHPVLAGLQR